MRKKIFIAISLIVTVFGCARNEPSGEITNPVNQNSLELITYYTTGVPEPSGLAYNSKTNSLFTVSDGNATVYELNFTGGIIHSFAIQGGDLEGITFSANCDTFYVAEETNQLITKYLANGAKLYSFPVQNVVTNISHGPEGITLNTTNNHLFALNERDPGMLIEYINKTEVWRKQLNYTGDCSDICYDQSLNCFWMVSDESAKVVKMSIDGSLLGSYSVPTTKMEGIVVVQDKIYLINDSDCKLYIFKKPV